ncbi:HEAT repeat domain-containing protein [Methanofollis formosanus]|uniref:HEAT repeat domain-containing protein n=2 Tax=Methanofollis formosanus TaxID=299308 RepID=A0A8G0ZZT2_9EURY|nr:HEAT repeat domain-containing protein [Methanofollis formosanus]
MSLWSGPGKRYMAWPISQRHMDRTIRAFEKESWDWREEFTDLGDDAGASLIEKLSDDDIAVRWKAAWALGHLGDPRAVDPLIASLDFTAPVVREEGEFTLNMAAAWTLGKLKDSRAVEPLIRGLSSACSDYVWVAAWALGEIGDRRAIGPLQKARERDEFECVWQSDASWSGRVTDPAEKVVLASITERTFHTPETPVEKALEKLGEIKDFT